MTGLVSRPAGIPIYAFLAGGDKNSSLLQLPFIFFYSSQSRYKQSAVFLATMNYIQLHLDNLGIRMDLILPDLDLCTTLG